TGHGGIAVLHAGELHVGESTATAVGGDVGGLFGGVHHLLVVQCVTHAEEALRAQALGAEQVLLAAHQRVGVGEGHEHRGGGEVLGELVVGDLHHVHGVEAPVGTIGIVPLVQVHFHVLTFHAGATAYGERGPDAVQLELAGVVVAEEGAHHEV